MLGVCRDSCHGLAGSKMSGVTNLVMVSKERDWGSKHADATRRAVHGRPDF